MTDQTDQEIAEETARNLGWELTGAIPYGLTVEELVWVDTEDGLHSCEHIEIEVFSWATFGLIIEKAAEVKYQLLINQLGVYFHRPIFGNLATTHTCSIKDHGYIKAVCLAFNEIFKKG